MRRRPCRRAYNHPHRHIRHDQQKTPYEYTRSHSFRRQTPPRKNREKIPVHQPLNQPTNQPTNQLPNHSVDKTFWPKKISAGLGNQSPADTPRTSQSHHASRQKKTKARPIRLKIQPRYERTTISGHVRIVTVFTPLWGFRREKRQKQVTMVASAKLRGSPGYWIRR